ncbi:MAG: GNAT family N-acetyltransferase [Brevundimonas sp.]|jgi:putative hemolysin|uniref:GNAT family N-acetyltransferase n=1 Tax=Brevundimonas sp. TaxID=1871086 RepID=UPI00391FCA19
MIALAAPPPAQTGTAQAPVGRRARDSLVVRLANGPAEVEAAQRLRYRVFYGEMGATPTPEMVASGRDFDRFDAICDHLLVLDIQRGDGPEAIIGTYRLLRRSVADANGGFYSAGEFDLSALAAIPGESLELGRACVDAGYRTGATMQRLWSGIATYVFANDVRVMFGCASLPGTDPQAVAGLLSYLHSRHLAPAELRPRALPERYVAMAAAGGDGAQIDPDVARAALPPLIKGYLRLGGFVGDGAVIDPQFGTIDVGIVVAVDRVTDKYFNHYRRRHAAE